MAQAAGFSGQVYLAFSSLVGKSVASAGVMFLYNIQTQCYHKAQKLRQIIRQADLGNFLIFIGLFKSLWNWRFLKQRFFIICPWCFSSVHLHPICFPFTPFNDFFSSYFHIIVSLSSIVPQLLLCYHKHLFCHQAVLFGASVKWEVLQRPVLCRLGFLVRVT